MSEAKYPRPRRKYSLEEIDRMRRALRALTPVSFVVSTGGLREDLDLIAHYRPDAFLTAKPDMKFGVPSCEEALRTYMLNGTTPEELEAKVREREKARLEAQIKQIAADVERETQRRTNAALRKVFLPAEAR